MRGKLLGTVIGRLAAAALMIALIAGSVWAWRTGPWYLVQDQYFITVSPDGGVLQRDGRPFNIRSEYDRSLLVSGPAPKPFGVDPHTNVRKLERELNFSPRIEEIDATLYSERCGFVDDKVQKQRSWWKGVALCNSADLNGEVLQAAIQIFERQVDDEISAYRLRLATNAGIKLGMSLLGAFSAVVIVAAGMWIANGRLL
jgi:hypothetical protein